MPSSRNRKHCAGFLEQKERFFLSIHGRDRNRSHVARVPCLQIGSRVQEHFGAHNVTVSGSHVERCLSILVLLFERVAEIEQLLQMPRLVVINSPVEAARIFVEKARFAGQLDSQLCPRRNVRIVVHLGKIRVDKAANRVHS